MPGPIAPGDRVIWRRVSRAGYGHVTNVPARVVQRAGCRVVIEAELQAGGTKRVAVRPENLRRDPQDR